MDADIVTLAVALRHARRCLPESVLGPSVMAHLAQLRENALPDGARGAGAGAGDGVERARREWRLRRVEEALSERLG